MAQGPFAYPRLECFWFALAGVTHVAPPDGFLSSRSPVESQLGPLSRHGAPGRVQTLGQESNQ
jgi:hypothetical protein